MVYNPTKSPDRATYSDLYGIPSALDVTVTSALQQNFISNAVKRCVLALLAAQHKSFKKYSMKCNEDELIFIPLAFELFEEIFRDSS